MGFQFYADGFAGYDCRVWLFSALTPLGGKDMPRPLRPMPLLGVLLADWLVAGGHYTREHIFDGPAVRPGPIAAWVAGFLVYEWLYQPADLGFWSHWLGHLPTPSYQIGASMPSFVVAFALTVLAVTLGSARAAARPRREPRARPG